MIINLLRRIARTGKTPQETRPGTPDGSSERHGCLPEPSAAPSPGLAASPETPPELHTCPHCGAGLCRLTLVSGGIIRLSWESKVKAVISCRDCRRTHRLRGSGVREHWLILQLQNQTAVMQAYATPAPEAM